MAAFGRGRLFVPVMMQCRHGSKINFKRPRPGTLERRIFEAVTKPVVLDRLPEDPWSQLCNRIKHAQIVEQQEENLYERFLVRQCKQVLEAYPTLVVFQPLSMSARNQREIRNLLLRHKLHSFYWSNAVIKKAVEDTRLAVLLPLLKARNLYVVSEEPNIAKLIQLTKTVPQMIVLAGIVEDRLLTKEGLVQYSKLPSLDIMLGQTAAILGSAAAKTRSLLSSHQQTLSINLEQYVKDRSPAPPGESDGNDTSCAVDS